MEKDLKQKRQKKQLRTVITYLVEEKGKMLMNWDHSNLVESGYKFRPSDEDLVCYYLKKKILNEVLPFNFMLSVNLYKCSPQQLTEMHPSEEEGGKEWYFFTPRCQYHEYSKGNNPNRVAGDGYWKGTGARTIIYKEGQKVGFRKPLSFYKRNARHEEVQTKWRMHEYRLDQKRNPSTSRAPDDIEFDDWVLCKIYKTAVKVKSNLPQTNEGMMTTVPEEDSLLDIVVEMVNCIDLLDSVLGDDVELDCDSEGKSCSESCSGSRRKRKALVVEKNVEKKFVCSCCLNSMT